MITENTLYSYLYEQYKPDENVQAFFTAYNDYTQQNLDHINAAQLPVFLNQSGDLLTWCGNGIYGIPRNPLPVGGPIPFGPLNTFEANTEQPNYFNYLPNSNQYILSDLAYQRVLQWNTLKGDGYMFTIRWLKRRVYRFLSGDIFPDNTYQVSVTFPDDQTVVIGISPGIGTLVDGAFYNSKDFADSPISFNGSVVESNPLAPIDLAPILKAGIEAGLLQLPFQYQYIVEIAS